jgi:hypothetical protein
MNREQLPCIIHPLTMQDPVSKASVSMHLKCKSAVRPSHHWRGVSDSVTRHLGDFYLRILSFGLFGTAFSLSMWFYRTPSHQPLMADAILIKEKIKKFCCQLTFEERILSLKDFSSL